MYKFGFIGAGSMAEAIISGLINGNKCRREEIVVTNRSNEKRLEELQKTYGVTMTKDKKHLFDNTKTIFFAMKPKDVDEAVKTVREYATENHLVISMLAGVSTKAIETLFNKRIPVIRAMPNTSATIRQSATALAQGQYATDGDLSAAVELFQLIGTVEIVEEDKLDAVTGLAGSGPAYIYYIVEAMEKAAEEIGLEKSMARSLIVQTLYGAALMLKTSDKEPSTLRKEIMSPGGTTEAGLSVLNNHYVDEAIISCVKRAVERSKELNSALEEKLVNEQ